jgi:2-keto-4-pentenoate hydratase
VPLTPEQVEQAASLLADARRRVETIPGLPAECRPADLADAYAICERLHQLLGWEVAGWYLGATNAEIQHLLGLDGPYMARVYTRLAHTSPACLAAADYPPMVLECEFAFRLGRDLPARAAPYDRAAVAAAIETVHPSIEVVASHLDDWTHQDVWSVIADNGTDGALVYGEGVADWRAIDLSGVDVELRINGAVVREGRGDAVLGDPLEAMAWLANARRAAGDGLYAGMICNTGTATSICPVAMGDHAEARFGPLGSTALTVVPGPD